MSCIDIDHSSKPKIDVRLSAVEFNDDRIIDSIYKIGEKIKPISVNNTYDDRTLIKTLYSIDETLRNLRFENAPPTTVLVNPPPPNNVINFNIKNLVVAIYFQIIFFMIAFLLANYEKIKNLLSEIFG